MDVSGSILCDSNKVLVHSLMKKRESATLLHYCYATILPQDIEIIIQKRSDISFNILCTGN